MNSLVSACIIPSIHMIIPMQFGINEHLIYIFQRLQIALEIMWLPILILCLLFLCCYFSVLLLYIYTCIIFIIGPNLKMTFKQLKCHSFLGCIFTTKCTIFFSHIYHLQIPIVIFVAIYLMTSTLSTIKCQMVASRASETLYVNV